MATWDDRFTQATWRPNGLFSDAAPTNELRWYGLNLAEHLDLDMFDLNAAALLEGLAALANQEGDTRLEDAFLGAAMYARQSAPLTPDLRLDSVRFQDITDYLEQQLDYLQNNDVPLDLRLIHGMRISSELSTQGLPSDAAAVTATLAQLSQSIDDPFFTQRLILYTHYLEVVAQTGSSSQALTQLVVDDLDQQAALSPPWLQPLFRAKQAAVKQEYDAALRELEAFGWSLLTQIKTVDEIDVDERLPPWNSPHHTQLPPALKPFWERAKEMAHAIGQTRDRDCALKLIVLESQEDQLNLKETLTRKDQIATRRQSDAVADQASSLWQRAIASLSGDDASIEAYTQRSEFRKLLLYYLQSETDQHPISTLDQAVAAALDGKTEGLPNDIAALKHRAPSLHAAWQRWREHQRSYGVGFTNAGNWSDQEMDAESRREVEALWQSRSETAIAKGRYDHAALLLRTVLETDLRRTEMDMSNAVRSAIYKDVEDSFSKSRASLIDSTKKELTRQYQSTLWPAIITEIQLANPTETEDELNCLAEVAFDRAITALSQQAYQASFIQFYQERMDAHVLTILQTHGVGADGSFSKECRTRALSRYGNVLQMQHGQAFMARLTNLILVNVPLILLSGGIATLARHGVRAALAGTVAGIAEISTEAVLQSRAFAAGEMLIGTAVEGTAFHSMSALLQVPTLGAAALDNYGRECALAIGLFGTLNLAKRGYAATLHRSLQRTYATGAVEFRNGRAVLQLTPGGSVLDMAGEIGTEAAALTAYNHWTTEHGDTDSLLTPDGAVDTIITILALRGSHVGAQALLKRLHFVTPAPGKLDAEKLAKENHVYILSPTDYRDLMTRLGITPLSAEPGFIDPSSDNLYVDGSKIPNGNWIEFIASLQKRMTTFNRALQLFREAVDLESLRHDRNTFRTYIDQGGSEKTDAIGNELIKCLHPQIFELCEKFPLLHKILFGHFGPALITVEWSDISPEHFIRSLQLLLDRVYALIQCYREHGFDMDQVERILAYDSGFGLFNFDGVYSISTTIHYLDRMMDTIEHIPPETQRTFLRFALYNIPINDIHWPDEWKAAVKNQRSRIGFNTAIADLCFNHFLAVFNPLLSARELKINDQTYDIVRLDPMAGLLSEYEGKNLILKASLRSKDTQEEKTVLIKLVTDTTAENEVFVNRLSDMLGMDHATVNRLDVPILETPADKVGVTLRLYDVLSQWRVDQRWLAIDYRPHELIGHPRPAELDKVKYVQDSGYARLADPTRFEENKIIFEQMGAILALEDLLTARDGVLKHLLLTPTGMIRIDWEYLFDYEKEFKRLDKLDDAIVVFLRKQAESKQDLDLYRQMYATIEDGYHQMWQKMHSQRDQILALVAEEIGPNRAAEAISQMSKQLQSPEGSLDDYLVRSRYGYVSGSVLQP